MSSEHHYGNDGAGSAGQEGEHASTLDREGCRNPFVGTRPFEAEDREFFFGRDEESRLLSSLVIAHQVVLLYARSGAGKTSLLQAELIPELHEEGDMKVLPIARVVGDQASAAHGPDVDNVYVYNALVSMAGEGVETEQFAGVSLSQGLEPHLEREDDEDEVLPALLILDQFEELFTTYPERWKQRAAFFRELRKCLEIYPYLGLLLSMREDFIAHLDSYAAMLPGGLRTRYRLERLTAKQAVEAMEGPAERCGRPFEPGAAGELVDNLRQIQLGTVRELPVKEVPRGRHVEPLHLQIVCQRLWDRLPDDAKTIGKEHVQTYADVDQALEGFYKDSLRTVITETGCDEWRLRFWFEEKLITPANTRGLIFRGEDETEGVPNTAVDVLGKTYLIRRVRRGDDVWYELAHDRLVQPIRLANRAWLEARLKEAPWLGQARMWDNQDRPRSLLLRAGELWEAERWAAAHEGALTEVEQAFLDACRRVRDEEQRRNLEELGWGVILARPALSAPLKELIDHRRDQAKGRYVEFTGERGYRRGESAQEFLDRMSEQGIQTPFYLLIAGDPEEIPYEFQYGLALQHAVGRVHFEKAEGYARYARSVVTCERGEVALAPWATFFGVQRTKGSPVTMEERYRKDRSSKRERHVQMEAGSGLDVEMLVQLMARSVAEEAPGWQVGLSLGEEATKKRLANLLGGEETPAFLFSATEAVTREKGDPRQAAEQGALLCADWPGPWEWRGEIPTDFYFSADDTSGDDRLLGSIAFMYTPHSAGTPRLYNFPRRTSDDAMVQELADRAFVAPLAKRLLGHPQGGFLAVIGHVDRTWSTIFQRLDGTPDISQFETAITRLLEGHTVGSAMEPFGEQYALLSSRLGEQLDAVVFRQTEIPPTLEDLRTKTIDVRNYVIVGDPAVRLPVGLGPGVSRRPCIEPIAAMEVPEEEAEIAEPGVEADPQRALEEAVEALVAGLGVDLEVVRRPMVMELRQDVSAEIDEAMDLYRENSAAGVAASSVTLFGLGLLAIYRRDVDVAVGLFREATRGDPEYAEACEALARLQQSRAMRDVQAGNYSAALDKLAEAREAADRMQPRDQALVQQGYVAKNQAQIAAQVGEQRRSESYSREAGDFFAAALELNPDDPNAFDGMGNVQSQLGELDAAIAAYERAVELAPNYTAAYHDLAIALEAKMHEDREGADGWCQQALQAYQRAYELMADDPGFSLSYREQIGTRIQWLERQCGQSEAVEVERGVSRAVTEYADLEIGLHAGDAQAYRVEARLRLPGAGADRRQWGEVPRFDFARLGALSSHMTAYGAALTSHMTAYGAALTEYLFASEALVSFFERARAVQAMQNLSLRLRLHVRPSVPELHGLYWETLRDPRPGAGAFLFTDETIPFSRYVSSDDWPPVTTRPRGDLKALVVVADPRDLDKWNLAAVDVAGELARARAGLGALDLAALCRPDGGGGPDRGLPILGPPTLKELVACLRDGYDVLYLVCHGKLLPGREDGGRDPVPWIWLEDGDGNADPVPAVEATVSDRPRPGLVTRLGKLAQLPHLVVLASCQSGGPGNEWTSTDGGALAALGPRLAEIGVPAIVAMQANVAMETVARFMPTFFQELDRDGQIDRALAAARAELIDAACLDWWVPVLFTRLESGQLFAAEPEWEAEAPAAAVDTYTDAYDLRALRELLLAAFTADDLRRLFLYSSNPAFRSLIAHFSANYGLVDIVEIVIDYCEARLLLPELLEEVQRANPRQYARFEPRLRA